MRVCYVIESAGSGSGQVVIDLARYGAAAGDEVTVIYAPDRAEPRFVQALESLRGVKSIALPMRRKVGVHDIIDVWRLWRCLRRHGPFDIIHSHSSKAGALARLAGLFLRPSVQVYTPHAFVTMGPGVARAYGWIERALSWISDAVIVVSSTEKTHARERIGIADRRLHMIINGLYQDSSTDRATARHDMGFADDDYVIGFAGRLTPQKNPARLVAAFALAANRLPKARLAIIGSGPLLEETRRALEQKGLSTKARFFTDHNARDFMPGFDCLLMSSDYEGFPIVFLEALAAYVPVVTTPVGGAAEATGDGETGIMTMNFAPESLAAAVMKLASLDPKAQELLRQKACLRAKTFDADTMGRKTRALYSFLLDKQQPRQAL